MLILHKNGFPACDAGHDIGDMTLIDKLKTLKQKSHMTNQQIAEKSNIPESTVARIFSGKTPNPTIETVMALVEAMGGNTEEWFVNIDDAAKSPDKPQTEAERYYIQICEIYEETIRRKNEWIKRLFWCMFFLILFLVLALIIDLFLPNIGYFRY